MASIVERNNSVSVVYYYEDEDGTKKQKWETVKKRPDRCSFSGSTNGEEKKGKDEKRKAYSRFSSKNGSGIYEENVHYTEKGHGP